uniref:Serpentine receptor class gamma n=1 Tax=Caenorhabditis tropicalis TaxID=1561998 RepID=A0A1I7V4A5_9PELO
MAYIQFIMIFLTSLNRFSMIFWSATYEKVWNKMFKFLVVFVFLFPIPFTYTIFLSSTYYTYTETLDCYTVSSTMNREFIYNQLLPFFAAVTISTAILNIASFYRLSRMKYKISVAERNLLFVSGALFVVQLVADVNTTVTRLFVNDSNKDTIWMQVAVTLLPYVSDGLTLIHPWLFLAFSSKARRCFMIMYFPRHAKVASTGNNSTHFASATTRKTMDTNRI